MTSTTTSLAAATIGVASLGLYLYYLHKSSTTELASVKAELAALKRENGHNRTVSADEPGSPINNELASDIIKPPLPHHVVRLLNASQLCFLSTSYGNDPHLSLMNFTYYQEEELVIMCTKRDTKKFRQIVKSNTVALLIHDFPHLKLDDTADDVAAVADAKGQTYSITLNGVAEVPQGEFAEKLRTIHLNNNPTYSDFIKKNPNKSTGECPSPAVLVVRITSARLCNFKDKVVHWDAKSAASES